MLTPRHRKGGTPVRDYREMTELEKLACQVAIVAPMRQGTYSSGARIPWDLIHAIRKEMADFDWQGASRAFRKIVEETKRRQISPRELAALPEIEEIIGDPP